MDYLNKMEVGYLEELEAQIGELKSSQADFAGEAAINIGDLCKKYNQIKGTLELALKAIEKIPFVGKKIAKAIRFLMSVADIACPADSDDNFEFGGTGNASESAQVTLSLEQIEAFERLDAAISSTGSSSFADSSGEAGEMAFNKDEICSQYKKVRKFLKPLLPIIAALPIPGIGAVMAAINLLMGIADSICGTDG